MLEKEIRCKQLDELKAGIFSGVYIVEVKHFDGRLIHLKKFDDKNECLQVYNDMKRSYNHCAYVNKYMVFDF